MGIQKILYFSLGFCYFLAYFLNAGVEVVAIQEIDGNIVGFKGIGLILLYF